MSSDILKQSNSVFIHANNVQQNLEEIDFVVELAKIVYPHSTEPVV